MAIDTITVRLLDSVLSSPSTRQLFTTIANRRIAAEDSLKTDNADANLSDQFHALQDADLIGVGTGLKRYYVTARGLKVARDLGKLVNG